MSQLLHKRNRVTKTDLDAVDVDPKTGDPTHHHIPVPATNAQVIDLTHIFPTRRFTLGVAASLLVLVATVIGTAQYVTVQAEAGKKLESEKAHQEAMSEKFATSEQLIGKLSLDSEGAATQITSITALGGEAADGYGVYSVAQQQTGSRHYSNLPVRSAGMGIRSNPTEAASTYQKFTDFFESHHFTKLKTGTRISGLSIWDDSSIAPVAYAVYESKNVLCLVSHMDGTQSSLASHIVSIGCGDKSSYMQAARELDSIYAAYSKSFTRPPSYIALGVPIVNLGPDGINHATLLQSDTDTRDGKQFEGMYTQQAGRNNWVYVGTVDEQRP